MAYISDPLSPQALPQERFASYLAGEVPLSSLLSSGAEPIQTGSASPQETPISQTQTTSTAPTQAGPSPGLFDPSQGSIYAGFKAPLQQRMGQAGEKLQGLQSEFQQAAGPSRTFEGIGGAQTLQTAVKTGTPEAMEAGKGILAASYGGPTGLNAESSQMLGSELQELGAWSRALGTGAGLQSALRIARPGMTPGEARFEARRAYPTQGWRETFRPEASGLTSQERAFSAAKEAAQTYAKQRAEEEKAIAEAGKTYLAGEKGTIKSDLETQAEAARAQDAATRARYEQLRAGQPPEAGELPEIANPYAQRAEKAQGVLQDIWGQYPGIADIDPLSRRFSTQLGYEQYYGAPGTEAQRTSYGPAGSDKIAAYVEDVMKPAGSMNLQDPESLARSNLSPRQKVDLIRRQRALEAQFQPFTANAQTGEYSYKDAPFGDVLPLFGETYEPGAVTPEQIQLEEQAPARAEQFSTEQQRTEFNRITDLLGEAEKLAETSPWQAAQIVVDTQAYLQQEAQRLEGMKESTDKGVKAYSQGVRQKTNDLRKFLKNNPQIEAITSVMATPQPQTYEPVNLSRLAIPAGV